MRRIHFILMQMHIFADPDLGSQNVADPTDTDPKHCFYEIFSRLKLKKTYCEKK